MSLNIFKHMLLKLCDLLLILWCRLYLATPILHPLQIHFSEYVLNIKIYLETYFNNNLFQMPMIAFIITKKFPLTGKFLGCEDTHMSAEFFSITCNWLFYDSDIWPSFIWENQERSEVCVDSWRADISCGTYKPVAGEPFGDVYRGMLESAADRRPSAHWVLYFRILSCYSTYLLS